MRSPLKVKSQGRSQIIRVESRPAPTGGWNARDSLASMKPGDAITLKNWFPTPTDCVIRGGNSNHLTGAGSAVKTLAVYNGITGTNKLFAGITNGIYDASSAGAIGSAVIARTEAKSQWVMFGDGTSNWLIMVNGTDKPAYYNGTAWTAVDAVSTPALTNLTTTKIIHVNVFKGRLFFIEKNSMSFWYLDSGVAGGALTEFDMSAIFARGGYLMWMATWTRDGGAGPEDYAVFMSSEGEIAVYSGDNPSSADAWSKIGTYYLGKPLGRRSFVQYAGDLIAITQNGAFSLTTALASASVNSEVALTDKITNAFNDASRSYSANFGWEGIVYPNRSAMLFNIPVAEGGEHKQYVMNTITKKWCEFDSWNAECFAVFNGELYFGKSTGVQHAWTGTADISSNIVAVGKSAFDYFGNSKLKHFKMFRPVLQTNGGLSFLTDIDVDFSDDDITGVSTYSTSSGAVWDSGHWDVDIWASSLSVVRQWTSPNENPGFCASGKLKIATNALEIHWMACDYTFEEGGVL